MKGFFDLKTPRDLYGKLGRDLARLRAEHPSADCAFDFFVTAYHILDWLYPYDPDKSKAMRDGSILLQICDHLATGAKHFEPLRKRHTTVAQAEQYHGSFSQDFSNDFDIGHLRLHLDGDAAKQLGASIDVLDLAQKVYDYWKNELVL